MNSENVFYIVMSIDVDEDDYDRITGNKVGSLQWLVVEKQGFTQLCY